MWNHMLKYGNCSCMVFEELLVFSCVSLSCCGLFVAFGQWVRGHRLFLATVYENYINHPPLAFFLQILISLTGIHFVIQKRAGFHISWTPESFVQPSPALLNQSKMCMGSTQFVRIIFWDHVHKVESLELFAKMPGQRILCACQSTEADVGKVTPQLFVLILCFLVFFFLINVLSFWEVLGL